MSPPDDPDAPPPDVVQAVADFVADLVDAPPEPDGDGDADRVADADAGADCDAG